MSTAFVISNKDGVLAVVMDDEPHAKQCMEDAAVRRFGKGFRGSFDGFMKTFQYQITQVKVTQT